MKQPEIGAENAACAAQKVSGRLTSSVKSMTFCFFGTTIFMSLEMALEVPPTLS